MASGIPYSSVIEGQLRLARRRLDAGEEVLPTLVVVGTQDARSFAIPFQPDAEARERWFYTQGNVAFSLHPRAALVVQDTASAALGLFGQARALVVSYQDADGLRRAQALEYDFVAALDHLDWSGPGVEPEKVTDPAHIWWGNIVYLPEGDPRWEAAALSSFFKGVAYSRRSYDENRQSGRRVPSWRFRK